ncbi:MAG: hypothetical protein A3D31_11420 [Candidatus Fluviicola riflensis]|nr:MAG: hypothetical protein CHH17_15850 [Candidatus Fluviicola riflensis]OGS77599.1 MAG: hypothetical protein A3D31_11420 [Candidatus Fluviicola riflensis]OGS84182.1 MAG: hypothetical protein A3E30_12830 [Fluviicola sp. RIFCSPHIGHO2_12_FULL_43_24]OGS84665.1 MAG: hypothetical protein A2724_08355 [Fluviicola sp. RIFCSPHIGHO2_01_FULL_43_53]
MPTKHLLLIFICAEILILLFQIFNYFSRKQDTSRLRFLLLTVSFVAFNIINLFNFDALNFGFWLSKITIYISGALLASSYFQYTIKELGILTKDINTKSIVWIFVLTFSISCLTSNIAFGTSEIGRNILITFPVAMTVSLCVYVLVQFRKKIDSHKNRLFYKTTLYSSFFGIILMAAIPFFVQVGQFNQLNLTLINIAFIFTIAGYLYKLLNDNIKEFEVLNQIRYFAGDDSILNYNLTKRELEIADLILKDLSYPEISAKVFLAEGTVTKHASNIFRKTGCINREKFREKFLN